MTSNTEMDIFHSCILDQRVTHEVITNEAQSKKIVMTEAISSPSHRFHSSPSDDTRGRPFIHMTSM